MSFIEDHPTPSLMLLSFCGSVAILFLMLGCALPQYGNYWPLMSLVFYLLVPFPLLISNRTSEGATNSAGRELALFFTSAIIVSGFALPVTLANSKIIEWGACALNMTATLVAFSTIFGFTSFVADEDSYGRW